MSTPKNHIKAYELLSSECSKQYRKQLLLGIALLLISIVGWVYMEYFSTMERKNAMQVAHIILGSIGLYAMIYAMRSMRPQKIAVLRTLHERPRDIVWSHQYIVQNMPFGVEVFKTCDLYLYTRHGHKDCIRVSSKELAHIQEALERDLPHATFGYTVQREQLYRVNPDMLYKD